MKKLPSILGIALVNLSLVVIAAILTEAISSLLLSRPLDFLKNDYYLNHTWTPHYTAKYTTLDGSSYEQHYNDQGWVESYDVTLHKKPGVYRIFYLGDSFTQGTCPMDSSVPSIVERGLNALSKGKERPFEVINTGTTSYSPTLFYLLVRHKVLRYEPDLIVVNVDMTDDFDDWKYLQTLVVDKNGDPLAAPPRNLFASPFIDTEKRMVRATLWSRIQLLLYRRSSTYNLVLKVRKKFFQFDENPGLPGSESSYKGYPRWSWCRKQWDTVTERNVSHTLDMLTRLMRLVKDNNVKIAVTSVPHYWQYAGNTDGSGAPRWSGRPHEVIRRCVTDLGVPYCNSYEQLRPIFANTPESLYYYRDDMHFNSRGYAFWADAQLKFLLDPNNGLLPKNFYPQGD